MSMKEIEMQIKAVSLALEKVEVHGHENLDIVLGSIQALNRVAAQLEERRKTEPKNEPEIKLEVVPD